MIGTDIKGSLLTEIDQILKTRRLPSISALQLLAYD